MKIKNLQVGGDNVYDWFSSSSLSSSFFWIIIIVDKRETTTTTKVSNQKFSSLCYIMDDKVVIKRMIVLVFGLVIREKL